MKAGSIETFADAKDDEMTLNWQMWTDRVVLESCWYLCM